MASSGRINVRGVVTAITYPGNVPSPSLDVILIVDNSDRLLLRFLGRRDMQCLHVGSLLHVKGVLSRADGGLVVVNPSVVVLSDRVDE